MAGWGDRAQVQELRKEVTDLKRRITVGNHQCLGLQKRLEGVRAENARLREALRTIEHYCRDNGPQDVLTLVAREALDNREDPAL